MESNHLPTTPLNKGYRVTAGNGEHTPIILKHTIIYDATLESNSSRFKYVLEYPLLLEDMIGLIPYPGVLLIGYRPTFMYPVRPFTSMF